MNELQYLNLDDPVDQQGFRTILVTNATHPYVAAWWPPGHIIGYEHEFTHAVVDFLTAMEKGTKITPNLLGWYEGYPGAWKRESSHQIQAARSWSRM